MSDSPTTNDEPADPSSGVDKPKPGTTTPNESDAMEKAQKDAAEEREEEGGYQ